MELCLFKHRDSFNFTFTFRLHSYTGSNWCTAHFCCGL